MLHQKMEENAQLNQKMEKNKMEHTVFLVKLLYNNEMGQGKTGDQYDHFYRMHKLVKEHLVRLTQGGGLKDDFPLDECKSKIDQIMGDAKE